MRRFKLDQETLGVPAVLERLMRVQVMDCFLEEDVLHVIVPPGEGGRAIGKSGIVAQRAEQAMHKKIKVIEFHPEITEFMKNIIFPLRIEAIFQESGKLVLQDSQRKIKGQLIGRNGSHREFLTKVMKRFFPVEEIEVR